MACDIRAAWELLHNAAGDERPVKAAFNCGLATQTPTHRFHRLVRALKRLPFPDIGQPA